MTSRGSSRRPQRPWRETDLGDFVTAGPASGSQRAMASDVRAATQRALAAAGGTEGDPYSLANRVARLRRREQGVGAQSVTVRGSAAFETGEIPIAMGPSVVRIEHYEQGSNGGTTSQPHERNEPPSSFPSRVFQAGSGLVEGEYSECCSADNEENEGPEGSGSTCDEDECDECDEGDEESGQTRQIRTRIPRWLLLARRLAQDLGGDTSRLDHASCYGGQGTVCDYVTWPGTHDVEEEVSRHNVRLWVRGLDPSAVLEGRSLQAGSSGANEDGRCELPGRRT